MLVTRDWPMPILPLRGNHERALRISWRTRPPGSSGRATARLQAAASYGVNVRDLMTAGSSAQALADP